MICRIRDYFFGPGFLRGVPSFFNKLPFASRGTLVPGFGPRLPVVLLFAVLDVVLFFDPTGRPRFFGVAFMDGFPDVLAFADLALGLGLGWAFTSIVLGSSAAASDFVFDFRPSAFSRTEAVAAFALP